MLVPSCKVPDSSSVNEKKIRIFTLWYFKNQINFQNSFGFLGSEW